MGVGNKAYAAGGQTIQCINTQNPDNPKQVGLLFSPETFLAKGKDDDAHDLVLVNDYLFVTAQYSNSLIIVHVTTSESTKQ